MYEILGFGPFKGSDVYHMIEEMVIVAIAIVIGILASRVYRRTLSERLWFFALAFFMFAVDSTIHTAAHFFSYLQIIWSSLILRFLAYIVILVGITVREEDLKFIKIFISIIVLMSLLFVIPLFHNLLPTFEHGNRFIMWVPAAVFALIITLVYFSNFAKTQSRFALWMGIAFAVITIANTILAVPSNIGDLIWIVGHAVRLFGVVLVPVALRVS